MTNEIKEILDNLKEVWVSPDGKYMNNELDERQTNLLLDYITNLQNEIFDLKDTIQNKNDCIGAYECIIEDRDKRIDKAVEYIDKIFYVKSGLSPKQATDLLEILQGDE